MKIIKLFISYSFKSKDGSWGFGNCELGVSSLPKEIKDVLNAQEVILIKNSHYEQVIITNWIKM